MNLALQVMMALSNVKSYSVHCLTHGYTDNCNCVPVQLLQV